MGVPVVSVLSKVLGVNASGVGDLFDKIVGAFHLSPEKAAEMEELKEQHAADLAKLQLQMDAAAQQAISDETKAALSAYQAEQTQDDGYTKHWRPTFGYMVTFLLFWNYAIVPLLGKTPVVIPDRLFEMFGALLLVAIGGRSFEKIFALKNGGGDS